MKVGWHWRQKASLEKKAWRRDDTLDAARDWKATERTDRDPGTGGVEQKLHERRKWVNQEGGLRGMAHSSFKNCLSYFGAFNS